MVDVTWDDAAAPGATPSIAWQVRPWCPWCFFSRGWPPRLSRARGVPVASRHHTDDDDE